MKKSTLVLFLISTISLVQTNKLFSQCGTEYSQGYINWDKQASKGSFSLGSTGTSFTFGTNSVLLTSAGVVTPHGANGSHTGNGGISISESNDPTSNYDASFSIGNGTITLTFSSEVQNVRFTIYDVDKQQAVKVTSANGSNAPQTIALTTLGSTNLELKGNNSGEATASGPNGAIQSSSNDAAVTVTISGTVKTVTLAFTKSGSGTDDLWIGDITGCVSTISQANSQRPLPVELTSFQATKENGHYALVWETASEKNTNIFEIERSYNNVVFSSIGNVSAAGNAHSTTQYNFNDENASNASVIYYRLKTVDNDGQFEYSPVKVVSNELAKAIISVFPNPTSGLLNIGAENIINAIQVSDINGKIVETISNIGSKTTQLDISGLNQGVYFIATISADGQTVSRIVKQ